MTDEKLSLAELTALQQKRVYDIAQRMLKEDRLKGPLPPTFLARSGVGRELRAAADEEVGALTHMQQPLLAKRTGARLEGIAL